jgi:hypothetical protein
MQAAAAIAGFHEKDAFDVLSAAYGREKASDAKCVMLRALAVCGGDSGKTREFVLHAAKSAEPPVVRVHAVVALAPWAKDDAVIDAVRKYPANDKLPENLRAAAAWLLGLCGKKDVADDLRAAVNDRAPERGPDMLKRAVQAATARLASGADDPRYMNLRAWIAPLIVYLPEPSGK